MSRFIGLIITVVAVAALIGAAIGWRFPFLGQNRRANQLDTAQQVQEDEQTAQTTIQPANPPAPQQQQFNQPSAQAPTGGTVAPQTQNTQPVQSTPNQQPIQALW